MCDIKKLCTCNEVKEGEDYWKLEFVYAQWPSWGQVVKTRPEHKEMAEKAAREGDGVMGPMPMPQFREIVRGIADRSQIDKVIDAEVDWLNSDTPFDFDYTPFEGDRLMYVIGGEEIAFSYFNEQWIHIPHQPY